MVKLTVASALRLIIDTELAPGTAPKEQGPAPANEHPLVEVIPEGVSYLMCCLGTAQRTAHSAVEPSESVSDPQVSHAAGGGGTVKKQVLSPSERCTNSIKWMSATGLVRSLPTYSRDRSLEQKQKELLRLEAMRTAQPLHLLTTPFPSGSSLRPNPQPPLPTPMSAFDTSLRSETGRPYFAAQQTTAGKSELPHAHPVQPALLNPLSEPLLADSPGGNARSSSANSSPLLGTGSMRIDASGGPLAAGGGSGSAGTPNPSAGAPVQVSIVDTHDSSHRSDHGGMPLEGVTNMSFSKVKSLGDLYRQACADRGVRPVPSLLKELSLHDVTQLKSAECGEADPEAQADVSVDSLDGAAALSLRCDSLAELDLGRFALGPNGTFAALGVLLFTPKLRFLSARGTNIDTQVIEYLCLILEQCRLTHLEVIDVSQNPRLDFRAGRLLQTLAAKAADRTPSLKQIVTTGTSMRESTRRSIAFHLTKLTDAPTKEGLLSGIRPHWRTSLSTATGTGAESVSIRPEPSSDWTSSTADQSTSTKALDTSTS